MCECVQVSAYRCVQVSACVSVCRCVQCVCAGECVQVCVKCAGVWDRCEDIYLQQV